MNARRTPPRPRRAARAPLALILAAVLAAALLPAAAAAEPPPGAVPLELQLIPVRGSARTATAWDRDGVLYLSTDDLSVLLGSAQYWRAELGRVTLTLPKHEIALTDGSDIAVVDTQTLIHLPGPAFRWEGRFLVPLDVLVGPEGRARSWVELPVSFSRDRRRLSAARHEGAVTAASIDRDPLGWKLVLSADVPVRWDLVRAERGSFVIRVPGISYDPMLYPLPGEHDWFQGLRLRNLPDGLELSFSPPSGAVGYRVDTPDSRTLEVLLGVDERDVRTGALRRFTTEREQVPGTLRLVALDPGHGGSDPGTEVGGKPEAKLTYDLCLRIASRLRVDLGVESVITREAGDDPPPALRAAAAARQDADLLLSVHVHPRSGGPAGFVASVERAGEPIPGTLASMGFRPYGTGQAPYLASSRLLARTVVDAVAARLDEEPVGVYAEDLAVLQMATLPAAALELGAGDGKRKWDDDALDDVAAGVVEGFRLFLLAGREGP